MPLRSIISAAVLAAVFALSISVHPTGAAASECEQKVDQVLQELGVSQDEVRSAKVVRRSASSTDYTLDAWVRLNACSKGALVVHMTRYCMVQDTYTTGDCSIDGLPNY